MTQSKDKIAAFKDMLEETTFNNIKECIKLNDLTILSNKNEKEKYLIFLIDLYKNDLYDDNDLILRNNPNYQIMNKIQNTDRYKDKFNNTLESSKNTDDCCAISGGN